MNDSPFGLTASIWTKDTTAYYELVDDVDAGTVFLNRSVPPPLHAFVDLGGPSLMLSPSQLRLS